MRLTRSVAAVAAGAAFFTATAAPKAVLLPDGSATDGPGAESHFGLARKDCLGTARNQRSKVWFTVANGVLSDVYHPTIDNTNNETLQYVVVKDGRVDLQTRDMSYEVERLGTFACRVIATGPKDEYRITTDYVTDPDRASVVMRSEIEALKGDTGEYDVFVRFDPSLNGNGGGGSDSERNGGADDADVAAFGDHLVLVGSDTNTQTDAPNRDYATPVHSALDADEPFLSVTNGFAGQPSDGLNQLEADGTLDEIAAAEGGNTVQTARIDVGRDGRFELGLGFGTTRREAMGTSRVSIRRAFSEILREYSAGWRKYNARLHEPKRPAGISAAQWARLVEDYYFNVDVIKASEDKTFPGSVVAAPATPWGQAISAADPNRTYFGSYRYVFARDHYNAWTALHAAGDTSTGRDMVRFLFERQQLPNGAMPRNSLINGKLGPDSFGIQLDEVAYPIVMAHREGVDSAPFYRKHIKPAADYLVARGPSFGSERWEEQSGFSPSTISAEIAGLLAAADIATKRGDARSAAVYRGVADEFQRNLKTWTLTTNGPLGDGRYFIRLSKNGDPNEDLDYNVGNGGPTLDQREIIDAGFLEYVRLGLLPADDPDIARSLEIVDQVIARDTRNGEGFYRYNGDGYGDRSSDGRPWPPSNQGNGHLWPVLTGERGQYELMTGDRAAALERLETMRRMAWGAGLIPEQVWELDDLPPSPFGTDPTQASIGFTNGESVGSAAPLVWSAAGFVRLLRVIETGRPIDRPANTFNRYVRNGPPGETPVSLTAPADQTQVTSPVRTAGTAAPGATVDLHLTETDGPNQTVLRRVTAGPDGAFAVDVPLGGGTWVVTAVATKGRATGWTRRTIVIESVPGALLFSADDPTGDDHGPGTYQYPTSSNFRPGAYDMTQFEVFDAGDRIVFRVRLQDLTPTFGSPLGAQLIDVYANDPGDGPTTTAASFEQRRYTVSEGWNRLIEVQGFGQRFIDAAGNTLGQVDISANAITRAITFSVPKAAFGTPGPGWKLAVVLHGQDGFSPDQARGFQPTAQEFQFGLCAPGGSSPICSIDPGTAPKAMDILVPEGTSQQAELDPTAGPVTIPSLSLP